MPNDVQEKLINVEKQLLSNVEIKKFSYGHEVRSIAAEISSGLRVKNKGPNYLFKSRKERGLER